MCAARASLRRTSSWCTVVSLFTDDERAVVGTTYKQVGKSEAIDEGLKFVGPKLQSLAARARELL